MSHLHFKHVLKKGFHSRIRKDCPQCRKKVNPKQIYRVILSFESDVMKFVETTSTNDNISLEKQQSKVKDMEQQLKSKE